MNDFNQKQLNEIQGKVDGISYALKAGFDALRETLENLEEFNTSDLYQKIHDVIDTIDRSTTSFSEKEKLEAREILAYLGSPARDDVY